MVETLPDKSRLLILAPVIRSRKGTHQAVLDEIQKSGFVRTRVDGEIYELDQDITLDRYKIHNIEAVVDRRPGDAFASGGRVGPWFGPTNPGPRRGW